MTNEELKLALKELRLPAIEMNYEQLARLSEKEKKTYEQYLFLLAAEELSVRNHKKIKRLLLEAKLPLLKEIEQYDFTNREGITLKQVQRLKEGQFVKEAANIVFYGGMGVGKTHLALGLVKNLCEKSYRCLYISTNNLMEMLLEAKKNLSLGTLWKKLDRFDLIACDELGYLPQSQQAAELFFQFISQRYERKSILITTNLPYSEWDKVFINTITTAAAVDRIIQNCETFNIQGPSHRTQMAQKRNKQRRDH